MSNDGGRDRDERPGLGLWIFPIGLPVAVLAIGCLSLVQSWRADSSLREAALACAGLIRRHFAVLMVALATSASTLILAIVTLHMLTD